jgi:outer membrane receptor protein involved in Fe transport
MLGNPLEIQQSHKEEIRMTPRKPRKLLWLAAMAACAQLPVTGFAQQATATDANPSAAKNAATLETVVVSATKRKEDASKIPLSVSVLSGDALAEQHITSVTDLSRAVPNMSFSGGAQGGGSGLSNIELRGISSQAGSSTVGVYLDDVSMTTRNLYSLGSAEPKFFDIDHIEVLRGPQGTLYGASSMGGTIKFISNQPNPKSVENSFSSEVSSTTHGGTNYNLSAVYNAPIKPGELALRLGVQAGSTSGYIDQVSQANPSQVVAKGINSERDLVFKAALKWQPTPQLSITPSLFYQNVKSDGLDVSHLTDINGNKLPDNQTDQLLREPGTDRLLVNSLTINYDMGWSDLTSVTSYYMRDFNRQQDGQAANSEFLGCCLITDPAARPGLAAAVNALPSAVLLGNRVRQTSQELRLASKGYDPKGSPWTWLAGVYLSKLDTR